MRGKTPMRCRDSGGRRKDGKPCGGLAQPGQRCRMHAGTNSGPLKHGRHSAAVQAFGQRVEELRRSPDLMRFDPDLALLDERRCQLLERWQQGDSPAWRAALLDAAATLEGDEYGAQERLLTLIREGAAADTAWADLQALVERRAALAARAVAAESTQARVVTEREMVGLFARMADIVEREFGLKDALRLKGIFEREVFGGVGPGVGSAGAAGTAH